MTQRNPEVDAWFAAKEHPMGAPMQLVRDIFLETDDRIEETIKWQTPTFMYKGNIASFNPAKKFVSLLFHRGAEIPGDHPRLEGDTATARTMRFVDVDEVAAGRGELEDVIRSWIALKDG